MQKFLFSFLIVLAAKAPVSAQTLVAMSRVDTIPVWSLANCISYARKNNITVNSLRLGALTTDQSLVAARAARYPNLTASATQGLTNYNNGLYPASGYGVSSVLTIYNGGYLTNDIKSKELSREVAGLNILAGQNDITLSITQAYYNILLAKETIVYQQDVVSTAAAQVTQSEQRYTAGTIAKKDLLELQATLANDQYTLITAQNAERQNLLTLKTILQITNDSSFDVSAKDSIQPVNLVSDLSTAKKSAMDQRPEVKSGELAVGVQMKELDKAKYSLRPSLTLSGSVGSSYYRDPSSQYFSQLNNNFNQNLGLTLSVPVFDRKMTKTNVAKAKINIEQARLDLQNTRTNLSQSVEQAYINVVNAENQYVAAQQQLNYTEESFRIANEQLRIGVYNVVEYLQQKNLYVQALQSYTQSKYSASLYAKVYNFYTGIPVTEN